MRRQNVYARKVLEQARPLVEPVSFLGVRTALVRLPEALMEAVRLVTTYDAQYTLQMEDVDTNSDIYQLRLERNMEAARAAYSYFKTNRPDVVIVPNGTIQELGIVYRVAKQMGIRVVTYEFGDQRQRIWLAQNAEVMRQETDGLWAARNGNTLSTKQLERMRSLFVARQRGALWENFARSWQGTPAQGGSQIRQQLGLDERPLVLLATNVLGDSLTLGRQVFSQSMAEWISRTVQYFAGRPDVQFIIRVHPGEVLTHGLSMVDVVKQVLEQMRAAGVLGYSRRSAMRAASGSPPAQMAPEPADISAIHDYASLLGEAEAEATSRDYAQTLGFMASAPMAAKAAVSSAHSKQRSSKKFG